MTFKFTDSNFEEEALKSEVPVLVDFYADWCGPCKMMGPVVEELAGEFEGKVKVGKINVDDNGNTAAKYNVMTIPTILILKGGEIVDTFIGVVPKDSLVDKLNSTL